MGGIVTCVMDLGPWIWGFHPSFCTCITPAHQGVHNRVPGVGSFSGVGPSWTMQSVK